MAMSQSERECRIAKFMKTLSCSREEAIQLLSDDEAIDHGERLAFDLPPEEEKRRAKLANVGERKTKGPVERKRQENPTKRAIISAIAEILAENDDFDAKNVQIPKPEKEITFSCGGFEYSVSLTQHRKPKN